MTTQLMISQNQAQVVSELQLVEFSDLVSKNATFSINEQRGSEQQDSDPVKGSKKDKHSKDVDFEKKLDEIAIWFENWSHDQVGLIAFESLFDSYFHFMKILVLTSMMRCLKKD